MAVVRVARSSGFGTGVFIAPDLVVTAGHVVQPVPGPLDPDDLHVALPGGGTLAVSAVLCLDRWSHGFQPDSDMAVVRTRGRRPGLVVPYHLDDPAAGIAVTVAGYPAQVFSGTVTREADPDGFDQLSSPDLRFPSGVSGGPIFDAAGDAIGVVTRSPPQSGVDVYIGIPFLDDTLDWLVNNCP